MARQTEWNTIEVFLVCGVCICAMHMCIDPFMCTRNRRVVIVTVDWWRHAHLPVDRWARPACVFIILHVKNVVRCIPLFSVEYAAFQNRIVTLCRCACATQCVQCTYRYIYRRITWNRKQPIIIYLLFFNDQLQKSTKSRIVSVKGI